MKLYDCTVLLHGEILNQVPKSMVTAAEIAILRAIHIGNNDAVTNIRLVGETNRSDAAERARLANQYGSDPFSLDGETSVSGTNLVNRYFPPGVGLPQELQAPQLEDMKRFRPEENETIVLYGENGEPIPVDPAVAAAPLPDEPFEDPFAMTREAERIAGPQPERQPLRSPRRAIPVEA